MRPIVCEILPEDLDARHLGSIAASTFHIGGFSRFFPKLKPRLLIISPLLLGIDEPTLESDFSAELVDRDFTILEVNRLKKILGHVVHRLNPVLQGDEIVMHGQRIPISSVVPLAFCLPLPVGGWAIYETPQTLTLRYSNSGFVSWSVRTQAEADAMVSAIDKLTPDRPSKIHHVGPSRERTEQISQLLSRPVVSSDLMKFPDFRLDLFGQKGWTGVAKNGWSASDRLWQFGLESGRKFVSSGFGVSFLSFLIAMSVFFWSDSNQGAVPSSQEAQASARTRDQGSAYWEIANAVSDEIRRTGINQIQELRIRVEKIKSSQELKTSLKWLIAVNPVLRLVDQKSQGLAQAQLQQTVSKISGVESAEVDLSKSMLTAKLRPIAINEDPGAKDLAQWMGGLKKTYAVQIETKNQLGSGLVFLAPEQPIANLVSFAAAISRHSGVRELILRAGSPGLGSLEFEMEPNP